MKKTLSALFLTLVIVGLSQSAIAASNERTVSAFYYTSEDEFIARIQDAIDQRAQEISIQMRSFYANNDLLMQMEQVDDEIINKTSALLVNPVDTGNGSAVINKAKSANIPVVMFNREPSATVLNTYKNAWYVGSNPAQAGQYQGEMIVDTLKEKFTNYDLNGDGALSFLLLKGEQEHPDTSIRTYYCMQTIFQSGMKFRQLAALNANWDGETARSFVELYLANQNRQPIELIIANNDSMALGAVRALQNAGWNQGNPEKNIPVFGIDANPDALHAIEQGYMSGTVLNPAEEIGTIALNIAVALADGREIDSNITHGYNSDGSHMVLVPYSKVTKH